MKDSLFDFPEVSIQKPIRLIEAFGGIGSQAMALRDIRKEVLTKSLNQFIHDYHNLADNPRYADNYNYKIGEYYKLLGDRKKQYESWSKIKDKDEYADLIKIR